MYKVYFNDNVNEAVELTTSATLEIAKDYINDYLKGYTLVDAEHGCTDNVFASSAVAQLEVYDGAPIKTGEDGNSYPAAPVYTSDFFYTR